MTQQQCPVCGTPVPAQATTCAKCGASLSAQFSTAPAEATQAMAAHDTPTLHYKPAGGSAPPPSSPAESSASLIAQQRIMDQLKAATLGEYEILAELGRGGMATVYLAHDISLDRKVAIKVMSPALLTGDGAVERFKREARTAGALSHPHIIPIHAVRESGDLLYFVMKFVEGRPLDDVIRKQGALPIPMVVQILGEVAGALAYAHRKGVVHRDVKPANIMLDNDGWAVVTDFGIAKVAEKQALTLTGSTVGTPDYMSPEQCVAKDVTGQSDQYSLGIVGYVLLSGRVPFAADSLMGIFMAHMNDAPPPLLQARPDCPPQLVEIIERMMAKSPADRWPSLESVVGALTGLQQPGVGEKTRTSMGALARISDGRPRADEFVRPVTPSPLNRSAVDAPPVARRFPKWAYGVLALPAIAAAVWIVTSVGNGSTRRADSSGASPTAPTNPAATSSPAPVQTSLAGATTDAGGPSPTARPQDKTIATNAGVGRDTAKVPASGRVAAPPPTVAETRKSATDSVRPPSQPLSSAPAAAPAAAPAVDSSEIKANAATAAAAGAPKFTAISAGGSTTCGALADDAGVICWGAPAPAGEMVRGLLFEKISVGDGHICGLTPAGEAYCWGSNANGQLGDGSTTERPGPTAVRATQRFADISVGAGHTCALATDGAAFCWGGNRFGQLGDGSRSNRNRPVSVRSTAGNQGFQSLAAGGSHTCGITRANKAFCWGDGFSGQVGNSMLDLAQEPFAVKTDLAFRTVVAGDRHTCGLTTNGRVYCWGSNKDGQLGNETRDDRSVPDSVSTEQIFVSVGAGGSHSCGITNRRQLFCWGQNADGRLGDGTRSIRTQPVVAAGGQSFSRVSAGSGHTCGLTAAGNAMCWGGNARGQLGGGSTTNYSAAPVLVRVKGN